MGRSLGPVLRRELENLDKDADSRKSAMKALKSYVKDLDSKAIPVFLAQVSETKETGLSSGEFTISLYEVLARVHGPKIIPQVDNIMSTVIKTLTSGAGSFALHQACSKVIPAISRYGIDPSSDEEKKRRVIHALCKPLSDSLLASHEHLSSGAALCLKALVDSDGWRFASGEMVNEVCQRVAGALQKPTLTNSHMGLVMSLAKYNGLVVEAYGRLLIQTGLKILKNGIKESNSQKRLSAIQMVNYLMKCLDSKSIFSELGLVIEEMEKCQGDQMAYVSGAAYEALQTAKRIIVATNEKGSKMERTGSNFSTPRRNLWGNGGDRSPRFSSPESRTADSFLGFDSPVSIGQRSVNRKLWRTGGVDVSLKDGLFSELDCESEIKRFHNDDFLDNRSDFTNGFLGFVPPSPRNGGARSNTPSPQRSRSQINVDNLKIFTTPRKLICSLQDPDETSSDVSDKPTRSFRTPLKIKYNQNAPSPNANGQKADGNLTNSSDQEGSSESVASKTDSTVVDAVKVSNQVEYGSKIEIRTVNGQKRFRRYGVSVFCGLFVVVFAAFLCLLWIDNQEVGYNLVPT